MQRDVFQREIFKRRYGFVNLIAPFYGREPVLTFLQNVLRALAQAKPSSRRPTDHSPISSRRPCSSSSSSLITCAWGMPCPASSSASAVRKSSQSSRVSRSRWKSATSRTTDDARPFCVMSSGRCVLRVRAKQSAIVLRNSDSGMTSSVRLMEPMGFSRFPPVIRAPPQLRAVLV